MHTLWLYTRTEGTRAWYMYVYISYLYKEKYVTQIVYVVTEIRECAEQEIIHRKCAIAIRLDTPSRLLHCKTEELYRIHIINNVVYEKEENSHIKIVHRHFCFYYQW